MVRGKLGLGVGFHEKGIALTERIHPSRKGYILREKLIHIGNGGRKQHTPSIVQYYPVLVVRGKLGLGVGFHEKGITLTERVHTSRKGYILIEQHISFAKRVHA